MNKKHWVSVYFNSDVPDSIIKELVQKSYELIVASLPLKVQHSLKDKEKWLIRKIPLKKIEKIEMKSFKGYE